MAKFTQTFMAVAFSAMLLSGCGNNGDARPDKGGNNSNMRSDNSGIDWTCFDETVQAAFQTDFIRNFERVLLNKYDERLGYYDTVFATVAYVDEEAALSAVDVFCKSGEVPDDISNILLPDRPMFHYSRTNPDALRSAEFVDSLDSGAGKYYFVTLKPNMFIDEKLFVGRGYLDVSESVKAIDAFIEKGTFPDMDLVLQ